MNVDDAAIRAALHHRADAVTPPAEGPARILRLASDDLTVAGSTGAPHRPPGARRWHRGAIAVAVAAAIVGGVAFVPRTLESISRSNSDSATARRDASAATGAPGDAAAGDGAAATEPSQGVGAAPDADDTAPEPSTTVAASGSDGSNNGAAELVAGREATQSSAIVEIRAADARALRQHLRASTQAYAVTPTSEGADQWTLRVPAERLDETLDLFRAEGGVIRTTVTRTNVSAQYVGLVTQRFSYATAAAALERAAAAETSDEAAKVALGESARIRARLAQVERRLLVLVDQIRYATITVRVSPASTSSAPRRRRSRRG